MQSSLKALLEKLVDYAGNMPPASLTLKQATEHYANYLTSAQRFMLGRFIVSCDKLQEFSTHLSSVNPTTAWELVLLSKASEEEIKACEDFLKKQVKQVKAVAFEIRLPAEMIADPQTTELRSFISSTSKQLQEKFGKTVGVFFEAGFVGKWRLNLPLILDAFVDLGPNTGVKLRCGGADSKAFFPSPEQLAYALVACNERHLQVKATAGLHHPFRHFAEAVEQPMHGFINLFGAAAILYKLKLDEKSICKILSDENPKNFQFSDQQLQWQDYKVDTHSIGDSRQKFLLGFGSCSFQEPLDDLKASNLL